MVWLSMAMLTLFTLLTFVNSWHDARVFDDKGFMGPGADYRLDRLPEAFSRGLWDNTGGLYRPLLRLDFELQSRLFGSWLEGYHLVNILLHLVTTLTLFGFVRYLLHSRHPGDKNLDLYALLAALVFAVHPVHAEVVNSVFNKSSMYVSLAAIGGLWWLLSNLDKKPIRAWAGFGLVYCIAILFKESALVLPGIAVAMIVLLTDGDLKARIRRFLPVFWLLIPIAIYFWVRSMIFATTGGNSVTGSEEVVSLFHATQVVGGQSQFTSIALLGKGMKMLAWPYPLRLHHFNPREIAIAAYIGLQVLLGGWAVYLLVKGRPMLAFALVFYYLALAPSVRLINLTDAGPHIAERYLYFPSVALTLALAFGFRTLATHLGRKPLSLIMLPVLLTLATISWDRNADWISEAQLFEFEYQLGSRKATFLGKLLTTHFFDDRFARVVEICSDNSTIVQKKYNLVNTCAVAYLGLRRTDAAIAMLDDFAGTGKDEDWIKARLQLASIHLMLRQTQKAVGQYATILDGVEDPASKAQYKGEMLLNVFPDDPEQLTLARNLFQQAIALNPELGVARSRIDQIDKKLARFDLPSEPGDSN